MKTRWSHTKESWRPLSANSLRLLPASAESRWVLLGGRSVKGVPEMQWFFVHPTNSGTCAHGFTHFMAPTVPWKIIDHRKGRAANLAAKKD